MMVSKCTPDLEQGSAFAREGTVAIKAIENFTESKIYSAKHGYAKNLIGTLTENIQNFL